VKTLQDPRLITVRTLEREADRLDEQLELHPREQARVTLHRTDDVVLPSSNWAP
jgi:hypothetical protein